MPIIIREKLLFGWCSDNLFLLLNARGCINVNVIIVCRSFYSCGIDIFGSSFWQCWIVECGCTIVWVTIDSSCWTLMDSLAIIPSLFLLVSTGFTERGCADGWSPFISSCWLANARTMIPLLCATLMDSLTIIRLLCLVVSTGFVECGCINSWCPFISSCQMLIDALMMIPLLCATILSSPGVVCINLLLPQSKMFLAKMFTVAWDPLHKFHTCLTVNYISAFLNVHLSFIITFHVNVRWRI